MRHRKCPSLSIVAAAVAAAFAGAVNAQQAVLPANPTVASGQVSVSSPGARQLVVNQQSSRAVVNWNSFSVGAGAQVNFVQPGSDSAILNRVTGATPSSIAGQINARGQVFLVNPNGIEITPTGTVRAAGATLSTLDIADADFLSGRLSFVGGGASATVSNRGSIVGTSGGFAALLGGQVSNDGRIEVPLGRIGVGSAERATLDLLGSRFLQVAVPTASMSEGRALVEVAGSMSAEGGRIEVSAATAREALRQAVNIPGSLDAHSVAGHRGDIVLSAGSGGSAMISGTLDVSSADATGGSVTVTADSITLQHARIDASGATGGGIVLLGGGAQGQGPLPRARQLQVGADAVVNADAARDGAGGHVVLWSDAQTDFLGQISARGAGPQGAGGFAEVSSHGVLRFAGVADLRGAPGRTGNLLLDPFDVTISTGADTGACCTATANSTVINTTTLSNALASANVTVSTGAAGAQNGDITVANAVSWNSGNTLTLTAARDINVNAAISGNGGLQLNAGRDIGVTANLATNGGAMGLNASGAVSINGATLDTGGGTLNVTGTTTDPLSAGISLKGVTVNAGSGTISGTSDVGNGLFLLGTAITTSGNLSISGVADSNNAVWVEAGTLSLASTGAGVLSLQGTSNTFRGIRMNTGTSLVTDGTVQLSGTSLVSNAGFSLKGSNTITVNSGNTTITGTATGAFNAIDMASSGNSVANNGTGALTLAGIGNVVLAAPVTSPSGSLAINATGDLLLNTGTQITWPTGSTQTLSAGRDINVNAAIAGSGGLQLNAGRDITINSNITASGGPLNVGLAASPTAGTITINNATIDTGGGNLSATATQVGAGNALRLFDATLNVGGGSGALTVSASTNGTFASGNVALLASGGGSITLSTTGNTGSGLFFNTNAALTTAGTVSVSGASTSGPGLYFLGSNGITAGGGSLLLTGNSTSDVGAWFDAGTNTLVATGGLSISGTSTSYRGLGFGNGASVAATGNIGITGTSTSERGLWFNNANSINANNGTLTLTGNSSSSDGVFIDFGANSFTQSGTGAIVLSGNSATAHGVLFNTGIALDTSGNVTLNGSTGSGWGVALLGGNALTASSGSLAISGASSTSSGVQFSGTDSLTNAGGTIAVSGTSSTGIGLGLSAGAVLTTTGDMTLGGSASASGGRGVQFNGAALTVSSGSLALTGSALDSAGILFAGAATSTAANNGAGLSMAGSSTSGPGVLVNAGHVLQTTGDVTLSGSGSTTGISLSSGATVDNTGSGTLHLVAATGGIDLGSDLVSPSGALWLTSAGNVTQGSGSVNASNLLLSGPGAYALDAAGNQLQTVAANTGPTSLHSATDLTVGSVLGTSGVTSSGALTLRSDGDLSIAAGVPVSGASPVLAAGAAFVNNAGPAAVTATSGRWLVYAADPATSSFGGLDSGSTALWNASYALTPPAAVSAVGNRYLFAIQPTLTFAPLDATKVYGDDATGAIQSSFTVAGFHAGVASAFLADTAATAYSGAVLATSPGATTTAGVAAGPYALSLSQGTLSSPAGYAFAFPGVANLTVTPRPITVSASPQNRWYGDPNPPLTYAVSAGNLVNADTLAGGLDTTALSTSPVGAYGIGQGTLSAGANYALSYVPASMNVWSRPTPVKVGMPGEVSTQPAPAYSGTADQDLANGWKNGTVTPADPARYIVLMVDDVTQPGAQFLAGGFAGHGQASSHMQSGGAAEVMAALERQHHLQRVATWPVPSMAVVCVLYRLPDGRKPEDLLAVLRNDHHVRAADQLQEFTPLADAGAPRYNDPYVDMQRGFAEISAARAHLLSTGRHATVAVVDTAVDLSHPDLDGRIAVSRDMVAAGSRSEPQQARHGTEVAGIIAASANNGQGIVGIAPAAEINAYRACWYPAGSSAARCNSFTLAKALADVLQSGARIVNLSLGGPVDSVLGLLLRRLVADGRIVVAALPLSGRAEGFPAGVPGVLVVASSEKGPHPSNILVAPGRDLLTLVPGGRYDFSSGSSLAAAHVSGAAALLLSMEPTLSADEVRKLLSDSAASPSGLINAEVAVTSLGKRRQYSLSSQH